MVGCCVPLCKNRSTTDAHGNGTVVKMYGFPKDEKRRLQWANAIKRDNWFPNDSSKICHEHFEKSMFIRPPQEKSSRLCHNAMPTLFNHLKQDNAEIKSFVVEPVSPVPIKVEFDEDSILYNEESSPPSSIQFDHSYAGPPVLEVKVKRVEYPSEWPENVSVPCLSCAGITANNRVLRTQNSVLEANNIRIRKMYKSVMQRQRAHRYRMKKKEEKLGSANMNFLNEDQIRYLSRKGKKSVCSWSNETIQKALKLRLSCGLSGYQSLLEQNFPLPSLRTLRRKTNNSLHETTTQKTVVMSTNVQEDETSSQKQMHPVEEEKS